MLTSLRIENFAIVAELELDFKSGMTAFTGETGAGKSIMIDALMLALGGRAETSAVRPGSEKCDINACFQYDKDSSPSLWLRAHDIAEEDGLIYLRRVIYAEGRSKSYINGQPFPLQKVKELSEMLVDIHGQHQHQTLLQHVTHRQQLDQYAKHDGLLAEVTSTYNACKKIQHALDDLKGRSSNQERRELLAFQIDELNQLQPQMNEMHALHEEHQLLHHACEYLDHTRQINHLLNADDEPNISQSLNHILQKLAHLPDGQAQIKNARELITSALIQCEEACDEITRFAEQVQLDPERLQEVEERMSSLHTVARKYQVDANHLPDHLEKLNNELTLIENAEVEETRLQQEYLLQLEQFNSRALKLRQSRETQAKKLAEEISQTIRKLGMPHGYMTIEITPLEKMQSHGLDKIEYKVCTNPGMNPDSLNKIASGGELSRISLAIQMITAQRGSTPTLLFDEVDVGIGGATAALVGQLLRNLGERLQIFCVTHQPQVAASAHHHFVVEKHTENRQTYSRVIPLVEDAKVNEIARMLGGLKVTDQTRSHAKELLASS